MPAEKLTEGVRVALDMTAQQFFIGLFFTAAGRFALTASVNWFTRLWQGKTG
jgi:hypothetical protein